VATVDIRPVRDDEWEIVAWLWQCFRHDLAMVVGGLPYADGRYQTRELAGYPSANGAGYLVWREHPKGTGPAPVGFALVDGLTGERRSISGFWVAPVARRDGVGLVLAADVIGRHPGPWSIAFQHDNVEAGAFWRRVADLAFGTGGWSEQERAVPGKPDVPSDHWIESL